MSRTADSVLINYHHVLFLPAPRGVLRRLCSRPNLLYPSFFVMFRNKYWFPLNVREPAPILLGPGQESQPSVSGHDLIFLSMLRSTYIHPYTFVLVCCAPRRFDHFPPLFLLPLFLVCVAFSHAQAFKDQ